QPLSNSADSSSSAPALLFTVRCLSSMCNCSLPLLTGSPELGRTTLQGQNQLRLRLAGKKLSLDPRAADAPGGRFAQPVFLQHLLDARNAHRLLPGFQQALLNRFQFPDTFPQNDLQDLPAQLRGELPLAFGPPALRHQALDALTSKIPQVVLYRVDVSAKRRR